MRWYIIWNKSLLIYFHCWWFLSTYLWYIYSFGAIGFPQKYRCKSFQKVFSPRWLILEEICPVSLLRRLIGCQCALIMPMNICWIECASFYAKSDLIWYRVIRFSKQPRISWMEICRYLTCSSKQEITTLWGTYWTILWSTRWRKIRSIVLTTTWKSKCETWSAFIQFHVKLTSFSDSNRIQGMTMTSSLHSGITRRWKPDFFRAIMFKDEVQTFGPKSRESDG